MCDAGHELRRETRRSSADNGQCVGSASLVKQACRSHRRRDEVSGERSAVVRTPTLAASSDANLKHLNIHFDAIKEVFLPLEEEEDFCLVASLG